MLWSRPAGAAVGTPNPGRAGHIAVTNATHFVSAGGMGGLGSEDMPSTTADVLELSEIALKALRLHGGGSTLYSDYF